VDGDWIGWVGGVQANGYFAACTTEGVGRGGRLNHEIIVGGADGQSSA
jgi:hypothetical protein